MGHGDRKLCPFYTFWKTTAWEKAKGQYGRVADAAKIIDPRKE